MFLVLCNLSASSLCFVTERRPGHLPCNSGLQFFLAYCRQKDGSEGESCFQGIVPYQAACLLILFLLHADSPPQPAAVWRLHG